MGLALLSCYWNTPVLAAERPGPGSIGLGLAIGGETRDVLGIGDVRAVSRGAGIASVKGEVLLSETWRAGVVLQLGAGWFDFQQPLGVANGNIKDQNWLIRGRVDRHVPLGSTSSLYLGLGAEYGESRSWTNTRFFSEEGPDTFHGGGSLRLGIGQGISRRFEVYGEVEQAVFQAHARSGTTQGDYNWIGGATSISIGLNTALTMGRPH